MRTIIDLSHRINHEMSLYPGTSVPSITKMRSIEYDGFQEYKVELTNHIGTHIDAPGHMLRQGKMLNDYSISDFHGVSLIIDCREYNETIPIVSLNSYKGYIDNIDYLIFYTGWSKHWGSRLYTNFFPVLSNELCEYISQRNFKGIGIDTLSPDPMDSICFENHKVLMASDKLIIENLTNLDLVPKSPFELVCLPLALSYVDAAPARVVALV
jgi:kynurenine formamidase